MVRARLPWLWLLAVALGLCAAAWRHFLLPWRQAASPLPPSPPPPSPLPPSSAPRASPRAHWLAEELLPRLVSLGLPLLPMAFPLFYAAARAFGGACRLQPEPEPQPQP